MSIGLLGKKLGMTRVYDENGTATTVTVVAADDNVVLQIKKAETDGYNAVQIGFDTQKEQRLTKPALGIFTKASVAPKKLIREFRVEDAAELEGDITTGIARFSVGDYVDVIGTSKGKGFAGVMKKHNFHGQEQGHGSMMHRRPGAIAAGSTPGRVFKNQGMPGHLGDDRVTIQNLKVVAIREEDKAILISGAIPGAKGCYVIVRPSKKKTNVKQAD